MKKTLAIIALALATNASASDIKKDGYLLAMNQMSPQQAMYSFMVDQLLEAKCGKEQAPEAMDYDPEVFLDISIHLKDGRYSKAKEALNTIQCQNAK